MKIKCVECGSSMGDKPPFGGHKDIFTNTVIPNDKDGLIATCLVCKINKRNKLNNNRHYIYNNRV
jgi:hypothetical protein